MFTLRPIAWVRTPYAQKLGVPRQSGLANAVRARVEFDTEFVGPACVRGLEAVSHLWLLWGFSQHFTAATKDTVRPPRLGGRERLGVFATRSSFRPNPIGLSLVELESVEFPALVVRGADLLDGTPLYDIKPYLPWAEAKVQARCEWAPAPPARLSLRYQEPELQRRLTPEQREVIEQSLALDARPAWDQDPTREWSTRIADIDVRFLVDGDGVLIVELKFDPDVEPV